MLRESTAHAMDSRIHDNPLADVVTPQSSRLPPPTASEARCDGTPPRNDSLAVSGSGRRWWGWSGAELYTAIQTLAQAVRLAGCLSRDDRLYHSDLFRLRGLCW